MPICPFLSTVVTDVYCRGSSCQVWDYGRSDCGAKAMSVDLSPVVNAINNASSSVSASVGNAATSVSETVTESAGTVKTSIDENTTVTETKNDDLVSYMQGTLGTVEEKTKGRSLVVQANLFHEFSFSEEAIETIQEKINKIG